MEVSAASSTYKRAEGAVEVSAASFIRVPTWKHLSRTKLDSDNLPHVWLKLRDELPLGIVFGEPPGILFGDPPGNPQGIFSGEPPGTPKVPEGTVCGAPKGSSWEEGTPEGSSWGTPRGAPLAVSYTHLTLPTIYSV